jgi:hypothetical protein
VCDVIDLFLGLVQVVAILVDLSRMLVKAITLAASPRKSLARGWLAIRGAPCLWWDN